VPYFLVLKRHMGADPGDVLLIEGTHLAEHGVDGLVAGGLLQEIPAVDGRRAFDQADEIEDI
jgi:hypothetical protein